MAIHSSILAWEIPWTEKPGGLQSMGSQRVGHDLATKRQWTNGPLFPLVFHLCYLWNHSTIRWSPFPMVSIWLLTVHITQDIRHKWGLVLEALLSQSELHIIQFQSETYRFLESTFCLRLESSMVQLSKLYTHTSFWHIRIHTRAHTHTHTFQFLPPSTSNQLILNWQEANPKSHPPLSTPSGYPSPLRHTWVKYNKCGSPHKC